MEDHSGHDHRSEHDHSDHGNDQGNGSMHEHMMMMVVSKRYIRISYNFHANDPFFHFSFILDVKSKFCSINGALIQLVASLLRSF